MSRESHPLVRAVRHYYILQSREDGQEFMGGLAGRVGGEILGAERPQKEFAAAWQRRNPMNSY